MDLINKMIKKGANIIKTTGVKTDLSTDIKNLYIARSWICDAKVSKDKIKFAFPPLTDCKHNS